jgi:hypothetical protein
VRDTTAILAQAAQTLDFAQPAAVLLLAILHFIPDADDPAGIVATLAQALAPGSYLVISHLTSDFAHAQVTAVVDAYNAVAAPGAAPMQQPPAPRTGQARGRDRDLRPAGHPMA